MKILLTGGSGEVGRRIKKLLALPVIAPSHTEFDITKKSNFIGLLRPDVIIHAAAIADATVSEPQRGDKSASVWRSNVIGTKNVVESARKIGAFVIFISSASVFTSNTPRIFYENSKPSEDVELSWYAVTKKHAEKYVTQGAIIRLSHPDPYVLRLKKDYKDGNVKTLFADQKFAVTSLRDVAFAIERIIQNKHTGVFHVVSRDSCSPHEILCRLLGKTLPDGSFHQFRKTAKYPIRYSRYHIIDGKKTAKDLYVPLRSWQQVVGNVI